MTPPFPIDHNGWKQGLIPSAMRGVPPECSFLECGHGLYIITFRSGGPLSRRMAQRYTGDDTCFLDD